jgi:hypothetical protein
MYQGFAQQHSLARIPTTNMANRLEDDRVAEFRTILLVV